MAKFSVTTQTALAAKWEEKIVAQGIIVLETKQREMLTMLT